MTKGENSLKYKCLRSAAAWASTAVASGVCMTYTGNIKCMMFLALPFAVDVIDCLMEIARMELVEKASLDAANK